jgi:hypothetical protein
LFSFLAYSHRVIYYTPGFSALFKLLSSNIEANRSGFLRWQRMAAQGRRIIQNSGRRIIIYAGN